MELLYSGGGDTLYRERGQGTLLLVAPLRRLERELALRPRLDPAWAVLPREHTSHRGQPALRLDDPGGQPLDRLHGDPVALGIALTRSVGAAHAAGLVHRNLHPGQVLVDEEGLARLTGFAGPGHLAYMAPEQTGRLSRPVDARSDLYSLGVILYQLLTGRLPFQAQDALEWVHCHLARQPAPPNLPAPWPDLLLKLLAKPAERRYQSARGLEADLVRCRQGRPFALGRQDRRDRLTVPGQLYGRTAELASLQAAFARVAAGGPSEAVVVAGYAGVGKSALLEEFQRGLPSALYAGGKHDQFRRDVPYAPLVQAFGELTRHLLGRPDSEVEEFRAAVTDGAFLTPLVPELEGLLGSPVEQPTRARFQAALLRFVQFFARPGRPLVLFIDDLQWLDPATLGLLDELLSLPHLLLLAAYRDHDAGPVPDLLARLRRVQVLRLSALPAAELERLVADALGSSARRVRPLARLIGRKTGGNPFFAMQLLTALADAGDLTWRNGWSWDAERIEAQQYSDNVVDLMLQKLGRLSANARQSLSRLACVGRRTELEEAEVLEAAGLVYRTSSGWALTHDRIQEAAYTLIPVADRPRVHLELGRELEAGGDVFAVVHQLNRAESLLTPWERRKLAVLNLRAARQARAATAYETALAYLAAGLKLAPGFGLEFAQAECEFLTGRLTEAEARLERLASRPRGRTRQGAVARLRMDLYTTLDRSDRALDVGLDFLRRFGIEWTRHPSDAEVEAELQLFREGPIEERLQLPLAGNPAWRAVLDVLGEAFPAAMFTDPNLLALVLLRLARLSLEHGNAPASVLGYMHLVLVLGGRLGDFGTSFRFADLALALVERPELSAHACRVYQGYGNFVLPWRRPVREGRAYLQRAQELARESGDLTFVAYLDFITMAQLLVSGVPLEELMSEAERALAYARERRFGLVQAMLSVQLGLIRSLRGLTRRPGSFAHEDFDEEAFEDRLRANPNLALPACYWWIHQLQARFYANRFEDAVAAATAAEPLLWTSPAFLRLSDYHFFAGLAKAALGRDPSVHARQLSLWARTNPANFAHRATLLEAEEARLTGRIEDAADLYEEAARAAAAQDFPQDEGLAHEAAARWYASRRLETAAQAHRQRARSSFERWGATAVVARLDEELPVNVDSTSGLGEVDLVAVIRLSQALSTELVLERLFEKLVLLAVEHAGAVRGVLVSVPDLCLEAVAEGGQVSLPRRPLTDADLPAAIVRRVLRTQESVREGPLLCLPLVRQGVTTGLLYLEQALTESVFTERHLSVLELLATQAAISLENARLYGDLQRAGELARTQFAVVTRTLDALAEEASSDRLLDHVVKAAEEFLGATSVRVSASPQELPGTVLLVPMLVAGETIGQLQVHWEQERELSREELSLSQALASQAALAHELARLSGESRRATIHAERSRVARDMHDTLAQGFTGVILQLEAAEDALAQGLPDDVNHHLHRAGQMARQGLHEARRSVHALRPQALERSGLVEALRELFEGMTLGTSLGARLRVLGTPCSLPAEWEDGLVRMGQELLANVLKHSGARQVDVTLAFGDGVRLEAQDDGRGFDLTAVTDGMGLTGLRERAEALGGSVTVGTAPGAGTTVSIRLPSKG